jgi:hypothetical protein
VSEISLPRYHLLPPTNRSSEYDDEKPRAFIVKNPGTKVTEGDIMQYMAGKVAGIKRLTGGVSFVDTVPKTPVCCTLYAYPPYRNEADERYKVRKDSSETDT